MDNIQKKRFLSLVKGLIIIIAIGLAYYAFSKITSIAIPCVFYEISGIYCPGCGISRMFYALFELDFALALRNNMLILLSSPFLLSFGARRAYKFVMYGQRDPDKPEAIFYCVLAVLAIAFSILRNTERFSFLAPI